MRKPILSFGLLVVALMVGCSNQKANEKDVSNVETQGNVDDGATNEDNVASDEVSGTDDKEEGKETEEANQEKIENVEVVEKEMTVEEKQYQTMIERSLLQEGNNYRIKNIIEKARKGEPVAIAYIGGSITEGANATTKANSYASLSYELFKKNYGSGDNSHITMVNAGIGGTPSSLGVIRYKRDVVDKLTKLPDIVFIEFAVNDHDEATRGKAYESLVRHILNAENEPAVILLFSVFQSRWNLEDTYRPIGKAYQLPMISIKQAVVPALDQDKTITDAEFFGDIYHPTNYGHLIMANCIQYLYDVIDQNIIAEEDIKLPTASYYGSDYENIVMVDSANINEEVTINPGSFTGLDPSHTFPKNWLHKGNVGNDPFTMEVTAKNMLLVFKHSNSNTAGKVDIYLDGELNQSVQSFNSGGWNNPIVIKVFEHKESKPHTITIKMADGEESKDFTIFAIGYTK